MNTPQEKYVSDDIIYALATPMARSALAVIRVSGSLCIEKFSQVCQTSKKIERLAGGTVVWTRILDKPNGNIIDEAVVALYKDGHGYTGEEAFEITCHGSLQVIRELLLLLASLGFRQAEKGEFTLRAFLHGKMDLTRAEAVQELVNSQGKRAQLMALNRLNGALFNRLQEIQAIVIDIMSTIEVQLDYAEDEVGEDLEFPYTKLDSAIKMTKSICDSFRTGKLFSQGARVVLAGATNSGKSSLFNLFLKEERSIVSNIKGTTRDFIEAQCSVKDLPIRLFDTAGLRDVSSTESIEAEGIRRSQSLMDSADVIVFLVDSTDVEAQKDLDPELVNDPRCILVLNKTDLKPSTDPRFLAISAFTTQGFDLLCNEIERKLLSDLPQTENDIVIESPRQNETLHRALEALIEAGEHAKADLPLDIVAMDITEAMEALGEITGEVTTDDILDKIFSGFCVGK